MNWIVSIVFIIICFLQAWENSVRRKNRLKNNNYRDIEKLPEVLKYAVAILILGFVILKLIPEFNWEQIAILAILTRMAWFNVFYNHLTGNNIFFIDTKGNSRWDRFNTLIFGKGFLRYLFYWILWALPTFYIIKL